MVYSERDGNLSVTPGLPEWQTTSLILMRLKFIWKTEQQERLRNTNREELKKLGFENAKSFKDFKYDELTASPVISAARIFDLNTKVEITALNPMIKFII
jgi:hypothetical protein